LAHIIDKKLQDLACPLSLFVPIAGVIGRTRLTQFLKNEKSLDPNIIDKLVAILDEMAELKQTSPIAPAWSDSENVKEQLRIRRLFKQAVEYDTKHLRESLAVDKSAHDSRTGQTNVEVLD